MSRLLNSLLPMAVIAVTISLVTSSCGRNEEENRTATDTSGKVAPTPTATHGQPDTGGVKSGRHVELSPSSWMWDNSRIVLHSAKDYDSYIVGGFEGILRAKVIQIANAAGTEQYTIRCGDPNLDHYRYMLGVRDATYYVTPYFGQGACTEDATYTHKSKTTVTHTKGADVVRFDGPDGENTFITIEMNGVNEAITFDSTGHK
jgi:hypothetical protein